MNKRKVLHIITGLGDGGAEGVLSRLCIAEESNKHIVISLLDEGKYGYILKKKGIPVFCLKMSESLPNLLFAPYRLYRLLKKSQPDVVQTWMYHADLLGGLVAKLAGIKNVFWGIRHSTLEFGHSSLSTILAARLCALLSYVVPVRVVCCAESAKIVHAQMGYKKSKLVVIPNGYDFNKFKKDEKLRHHFRAGHNMAKNVTLLGMVGRYNSQKGHDVFIRALGLIKDDIEFNCCLVGRGMDLNNKEIMNKLEEEGIKDRVIMLGQRDDVVSIMNALDLHVLPSTFGEGFPNVVAESIASGTPCLVSNVGDAASIVENPSFVVPPGDEDALAERLSELITLSKSDPELWADLSHQMHSRVHERFSMASMVEKYNAVWSLKTE